MAEATTAATYQLSPQWKSYLTQLQTELTSKAPQIEYKPQTSDQLKVQLAAALRPGYDKAIADRQKAVASTNASIDADAAARGLGSSTWVTDVKNRQKQTAANDVATLEGSYSSALAQQLMAKLSEQENRKLTADQYNASQKSTALQQALAALEARYDTFKTEDPTKAAASSGAGGYDAGAVDDGGAARNKAGYSILTANPETGKVASVNYGNWSAALEAAAARKAQLGW